MNRRSILKGAGAPVAAVSSHAQADLAKRAIRVQQGEDRFNERIPIGAKSSLDRKLSGKDTGGLWSMFEAHWCLKGGPPLHFHHGEDEWFYVIDGEYLVQVGDEKFKLGPGDSLLAPREVPHAYAHLGDGEGKMLLAYQPAGDMESFFLKISRMPGTSSVDEIQRVFSAHGMEVVGPPLKV
jgi:mannose-6-phosphate isomerase-like protein (cupin superfamily)